MRKASSGFSIENSRISDGLEVFFSKAQYYTIENSTINGDIDFENSKMENLLISKCAFKSNTNFLFESDTISNFSIDTIKRKAHVTFENCLINGTIDMKVCDSLKVNFINVTFGKNAVLSVYADSIVFDHCIGLSSSNIFSYLNNKITFVSFHNTDFSNLQMEYSNMKFFSLDSNSDETVFSMYERSLSKFRSEGKMESYKNADIDYKKYKYSKQGFLGTVSNLIDRLWWNYSYTKSFIIYWTLLFISIFFIINIIAWKKINEVYPIMVESSSKTNYKKQKESLAKIFLFTIFIFFSLRVDFDKLKYNNNKILAWFFIQYVIGLVCVFFIANAILKIG